MVKHQLVKDLFWARANEDPIDAHSPSEFVYFDSTGGETPYHINHTRLSLEIIRLGP